jgi:hypothetical protein
MATMAFLTTMVLMSSAVFAAQIDVEIDQKVVAPGDTITVTGVITGDDGNAGEFDYRVAAVVPGQRNGGERIIVCDSERQTTADGAVSFECQIPTLEELEELGVVSASDRSVIPLRGGIVTMDPTTGEVTKKHGRALIVNTENFLEKFEAALERLDGFIEHAEEAMAKCDEITARAEEAGAENVIKRCAKFQEKMQEQIDTASNTKKRIQNAIDNLSDLEDFSFDGLKDSFVKFKHHSEDFKIEVREIRDVVHDNREDLNKRIAKEIADKAKDRADELRNQIKEREDAAEKLRDVRAERIDKIRSADAVKSSDHESMETETDEDDSDADNHNETEEDSTAN